MWEPIETAPKDGRVIIIKSVAGNDINLVIFEGESNWRSENKKALFDSLTGECFAEVVVITGWMRADVPYRVPGIAVTWKDA